MEIYLAYPTIQETSTVLNCDTSLFTHINSLNFVTMEGSPWSQVSSADPHHFVKAVERDPNSYGCVRIA